MSDIVKYDSNTPLDKQSFMKEVGNLYGSDLFPKDWDAEQKALAEKELLSEGMVSGMWSKIPKTCNARCPLNIDNTCKLSNKPFGEICPEEKAYTEFLVRYYMDSLDVEQEDIASISLIRDLVDVEIQLMRLAKVKSGQDFTIEQTVSFSMTGEEITQIQENPIHSVDAKLAKRKQDILKLLAATREAKAKLIGVAAQVTSAQRISQLMEEVERQLVSGKSYGGDIIDADEIASYEYEEEEID